MKSEMSLTRKVMLLAKEKTEKNMNRSPLRGMERDFAFSREYNKNFHIIMDKEQLKMKSKN